MASPVTIQPSTIDTTPYEGSKTVNSGNDLYIYVSPTTAARRRALLKFDFSAVVPAGATITLATLSLYCPLALASRTITVYRLLRTDWVETIATWNIYKTGTSWGTAGALGSGVDFTPTDVATAASVATGQWLNETVTAQVQTALNSVGRVAHFLIVDEGATNANYNYYTSRENATTANRPKLYIEYSSPPNAPTSAHTNSKTDTEIIMHWTDNSADETGFKMYLDNAYIETIAAGSVSYTYTGLTAGTQYDLAVKATNASGDSAEAQLTETTLVLAEGGAGASIVASAQGSGTAIRQGSAESGVIASASGAGVALAQGGSDSVVIVSASGVGNPIASGASESIITVTAEGTGSTARVGASEAPILVSANGSGVATKSGAADASIIVSASGAGVAIAETGGGASIVVSADGAGLALRSGASEAGIAVTVDGSGVKSVSGGAESAISAAPEGSGIKSSLGGSGATVTATAQGSGVAIKSGGVESIVFILPFGDGYAFGMIIPGGSESAVSVGAVGSGSKTAQGAGECAVIVVATGSGRVWVPLVAAIISTGAIPGPIISTGRIGSKISTTGRLGLKTTTED